MHRVVPFDLNALNIVIFDFTNSNGELRDVDLTNTEEFTNYILAKLQENESLVGIGKYNEDRNIYARSSLFCGTEVPRTVHLGIDIWAPAGTPVFTPLLSRVHSFANNAAFGDYGPTIILEHIINGVQFYTLYGHLSLSSLAHLHVGAVFEAGKQIAAIGTHPTNGSWPPHLHFQIITDMQGKKGDYPGVASLTERKRYLELCPDPNLILGIRQLLPTVPVLTSPVLL